MVRARISCYSSFLYLILLFALPVGAEAKAFFYQADSLQYREKVHLHFDKPNYFAGDTIWFKAYLLDGDNRLTEHSSVLYVDFIGESDVILHSMKLPLEAGLGWAEIPLASELPNGNYRVRAYTNWMRNYGSELLFEKQIPVSDIFQRRTLPNITWQEDGSDLVAHLQLLDIDGSALKDQEVRYQLVHTNGRQSRGKLSTDTLGRTTLRFEDPDRSGKLILNIPIAGDTLSRSFPLPLREDFDVSFFPEGGELIHNLPTRLAFKVLGSDGRSRQGRGYITASDTGQKIAEMETEFGGMGYVGFNPQSGQSYQAHFTTADGRSKTFALPRVLPEGTGMTISQDESHLIVRVRSSPGQQNAKFQLLISADEPYLTSTNTAGTQQMILKFPRIDLRPGISRITLLAQNGQPMAERLVFVDKNDLLNFDIGFESQKSSTEVKSRIMVKDKAGKPVLAALSLSIVDDSGVPADEDKERTILSNLLLTSELKGNIEQPNYYFNNPNVDKARQLDILMMTQGWRRFERMSADKPFEAENSLVVKGIVRSPLRGDVPHGAITLLLPGTDHAITEGRTDARGHFRFDSLYFEGQRKGTLIAKNAAGRTNVQIKLNEEAPPAVIPLKADPAISAAVLDSIILEDSDDDLRTYIKRRSDITRMQILEEVVVRAPKPRKVPNSHSPRDAEITFLEEDIYDYPSLSSALMGKIPGVFIISGKAFRMRDMASSVSGPVAMQILIDGMPTDPEMTLDDINLANIEAVEILRNIPEYALYGRPSILITMKRGPSRFDAPMNTLALALQGFTAPREFYQPTYSMNQEPHILDKYKTLYWNPNILTTAESGTDISFQRPRRGGPYRITIEAVDEFGRLGRKVFTGRME